ncbi:hypothetical protein K1719_007274 [Acacia pycnantha]|nr:hypothetical protein K1719_007274 [Acacia pycnantha]
MVAQGVQPNLYTHNILIDGLCKGDRLNDAWEIFKYLLIKGYRLDVYTYNIMINGLCRQGMLDEAMTLLAKMKENNCLPNSITYTKLLEALLERKDARGLLKAAIRDPDPVVFLENELLYGESFLVSDEVLDSSFCLPIGKAKIEREGKDVTITAYSKMVDFALKVLLSLCSFDIVLMFDLDGNEAFSEKIGVFPLVTQEPAKRNSVNRFAVTLVTKPIISITKDVSRQFLIEHVVPAIKEKWPRNSIGEPIYIQQDHARCHIHPNDSEFCRVATEDEFDICLMNQPPNSPGLNILDLGFFNGIQYYNIRKWQRQLMI